MADNSHRKSHGVGLDLRVSLDFLIQREDTAFSSKSKAVTNKHGLRYLVAQELVNDVWWVTPQYE